MRVLIRLAPIALALAATGSAPAESGLPLRLVADVPLPGPSNRFDYTSIDPRTNRLYIAHMDAGQLLVFDMRKQRVLRSGVVRRVALPGCDSDHGLHLDPPRRLAFVACDGNAVLLTLDLTRMKVVGREAVGDGPDVLAFDTSSRRLYVAAESGDVAVFVEHGRRLEKLAQAKLAPEAHTVAVDPRTHRVYFPIERGRDGKPRLWIMAPTS